MDTVDRMDKGDERDMAPSRDGVKERDTEVRLAMLEKGMEDLDHELNGNGQPGRLEKLERAMDEKVRALREDMAESVEKIGKDIESIKATVNKLMGAALLLGALLGVGGTKAVQALGGHEGASAPAPAVSMNP